MRVEIGLLGKTYLGFKGRPIGDYTRRQMSAAAAYTVFCHAEFENFLEGWANTITDFADANWKMKRATRPLAHLCTFQKALEPLSSVPKKDIWNEPIMKAINLHRNLIKKTMASKNQMYAVFSLHSVSISEILTLSCWVIYPHLDRFVGIMFISPTGNYPDQPLTRLTENQKRSRCCLF